MEKVSIIIPVFNIEKYLNKCLQSCVCQTYDNLQIIVIDDESKDSSGIIADEWAKKDSRIEVYHKENGGLSDARNFGLSKASGEYVCFVDGDDYIDKNMIYDCIEAMDDQTDFVSFNYIKVDEDGNRLTRSQFAPVNIIFKDERDRISFIVNKLLTYEYGWETWSKMYRMSIINAHRISFEDNRRIFAEDIYFTCCYLAFSRNYKCLYDVEYNYLQRNNSIMGHQNEILNFNRINELSKALKSFYVKREKTVFVDFFPIIHFMLLKGQKERCEEVAKDNNTNLYQLIIDNIEDKKFFNCQLENFLNNGRLFLKIGNHVTKLIFFDDARALLGVEKRNGLIDHYIARWLDFITFGKAKRVILLLLSAKRIFILGTEDFGNIGDHQIARSMIAYFKGREQKIPIVEITASEYFSKYKKLRMLIRKNDLIVMPGGGNIGDVYEMSENIRASVISTWKGNKKIIFPQSINYTKGLNHNDFFLRDKALFSDKNLTLLLRGKKSYDFAKKHFECKIGLYPDIVLGENESHKKSARKGVICLLRSDEEKSLNADTSERIIEAISQKFDVRFYDTQQTFSIDKHQRDTYCKCFLNKICSSEAVVTDRLHGMIFSAITGTPCLVIDNNYGKLSECFKWVEECDYMIMFDDKKSVDEQVARLVSCTKARHKYSSTNKSLLSKIDY